MSAKERRPGVNYLLFALVLSSIFMVPKIGNAQATHFDKIDAIYSSQMELYDNADFTNSIFYTKKESKKYPSSASFKIKFDYLGKRFGMKSTESCTGAIQIFKDKYEIYDSSYKQYKMEGDSLDIAYTIYNLSDCITLNLNGKRFMFNLIDGGCDIHIKYLEHSFSKEGNTETMTMKVTEDILLFEDDNINNTYMVLKKGSEFKWTTTDTD